MQIEDTQSVSSSPFDQLSVANAISTVSNPVKHCEKIAGIQGMVLWERNSDGPIEYLSPNHHTLSVYLGGGNGTWSCEKKAWGFSEAICFLPKGCDTRWKHNGYVKNLHIYFTDDDLSMLNGYGTQHSVPSIYARSKLLHTLAQMVANELDWTEPGDQIAIDHLVLSMLSQLSKAEASQAQQLPASTVKRLDDRMFALEQGPATLQCLATLANMSARNLSRLYKTTTHMTLMERQRLIQVEEAKCLLKGTESLNNIALACGFSSQSHFSRVFRHSTGKTPLAWRRSET